MSNGAGHHDRTKPRMAANWVLIATQMVGGIASVAGAALWAVLLSRHGGNPTGYLMMALAVVGIVASLLKQSTVLAAVAIVSFVPVGFYMFGSPAVWTWIGRSEILMLLAAIIMGLAKRSLVRQP